MSPIPRDLYLISGAAGFVGSEVLRAARAAGQNVRVLLRPTAKRREIEDLGVEIVEGDLKDARSLKAAVQGVRGVYHIAAVYRETNIPDSEFFDVNTEGTRRLLQACIAAGVKRFVHCSTIGVLGDIKNPPADEDTPYAPDDVYQRSKVEGEKCALEFLRSGKIGGVVIRPAMIYGPGDTRFLKLFKAIAWRYFVFFGSGEQLVHYIDVRDLAAAFVLAMQREDLNGSVYTIAGERALSFKEFVFLIADALGVPRPKLHVPLMPLRVLGAVCEAVCAPLHIPPPLYRRRVDFFAKSRAFDTKRACMELGFKPRASVEAEVVQLVDWYRSQGWL